MLRMRRGLLGVLGLLGSLLLGACREKNDLAASEVREMAPNSVTAPKNDTQDEHDEDAKSAAAAENEGDAP